MKENPNISVKIQTLYIRDFDIYQYYISNPGNPEILPNVIAAFRRHEGRFFNPSVRSLPCNWQLINLQNWQVNSKQPSVVPTGYLHNTCTSMTRTILRLFYYAQYLFDPKVYLEIAYVCT